MRLRMTDSISRSASAATLAVPTPLARRVRIAVLEHGRADANQVARPRRGGLHRALVEKRPVRRFEIGDDQRRALHRERAMTARDRLVVDVNLALHDAADRHRRALDERVDERGSTDGNLNSRRHGYRIPVSCTPRRRSLGLCRCSRCRSSCSCLAAQQPSAQSSSWLDAYRDHAAPADCRVAVESLRVGTPRAARRHVRPSPERLGGARERHQVGRGRDEERRPGQRPRRTGQGAALGARPGERRDHVPASIGAGHARPRQQRRHAGRRHRGRGARGPHRLPSSTRRAPASRERSSSSTSRSRPTARPSSTAPPARRARPRSAPPPRSSAPSALRDCARRTPARSATPTARRRFPRPPSRSKTPSASSACRTGARRSALRLKMEAKFLPDADSANVIGEIRGRERPDEVVVVGGHFDSWDVGTGSTDDGGGCVVTWEALRLMKKLNLRPRRTVRVVLFTNEENGLAGGRAYLERYRVAARQPRADARVRQRRLPPDGLRLHRQLDRARDAAADRGPAPRHSGRSDRRRPAAARTSARASRPASSRRCRSRWRATTS